MARVVVITIGNGEKASDENQGDDDGLGDGFVDSKSPQPGPKQPKIARGQELDQVRRADVQDPRLGFAVEKEIERGPNQSASRRNRVEPGTCTATAEDIIGFENNDVMPRVVEMDLELAENRQAKR